MRRVALFLTALFAINLILTPAQSAVKAGEKCAKQGATSIVSGKKYTCIKSGNKLVWNKGVAIPKKVIASEPTLVPTMSPTQTLTPTPGLTTTPSPTVTNISTEVALQQYKDAKLISTRCDFKKYGVTKVLGIDYWGRGSYVRCSTNGFWYKDINDSVPVENYSPKINISEFNTLTFPWKSPCEFDPWVPSQWKEYEQFAMKTFGCSRPLRFVDVSLPNVSPKAELTHRNELNQVSVCKLPEVFVRTSQGTTNNVGHRNTWKFSGDLIIQVIPVQFTDFKASKSPIEDYGAYIEYFKEMFYKTSDGNTRIQFRIPNEYLQLGADLKSFDTGQMLTKNLDSWHQLDLPKFQKSIFDKADSQFDFTGVKMTLLIFPLTVPDNYIAHHPTFRMDNVFTNEGVVPSTYIMPPANANSRADWYGVEPFLHLHEFFHANGMLSDHLGTSDQGGDFYGTGNWGNMAGMLTDHILWDKWLAGMLSDSQVICGKSNGTSTYWLKPATYFGQFEKLLVIPLSSTRAIAVESQRLAGMNYKLTSESIGALVYTVDVLDDRYDGGFEVIKPTNRTTSVLEGPFIYYDAPLKLNESVTVWGYKITVIESGDFGDVVKVEKI